MKKHKPNPKLFDEENPEWTAAGFKRARSARQALLKIVGGLTAELLLNPNKDKGY